MSLRQLTGPLRPLRRADLERPVLDVAPTLLGSLLVRASDDGETIVRVVEVEAYREDDPASHSFGGPRPRAAAMFGPAGHAYVYFTYGMHWSVNVVCEPSGVGAAVLLRAAVVIAGHDLVRARRGPRASERDLLRGPGRLASGLGIDRALYGADLLDPGAPLRAVSDGWTPDPATVANGPRIGVRVGAATVWRWWLEGVPEVSRYVRHPKAMETPTQPAPLSPGGDPGGSGRGTRGS